LRSRFGGQQKIYRGAGLINGPMQILPCTFDPHIGLVHSPAGTYRALVGSKLLIQRRNILEHPAIERGVVYCDTVLFLHFLKLAVTDWLGDIPTDGP
jgi:hypothetical protein